MKYLKYFEGHSDDLLQDVRDICLELDDIGFRVIMYKDNQVDDIIKVSIAKYSEDNGFISFNISEVSDVVDRVKMYLGNRFIGIKYSYSAYILPGDDNPDLIWAAEMKIKL